MVYILSIIGNYENKPTGAPNQKENQRGREIMPRRRKPCPLMRRIKLNICTAAMPPDVGQFLMLPNK